MDRAREPLEPVDHPRPVAVEQRALDRVHPTPPEGRQRGEPLPRGAERRRLVPAMARENDDVGPVGHDRLEAETRIRAGQPRRDARPAGELDQLGDERLPPGDDQRLGPEHVEHAGARVRPHRLDHTANPPPQALDERRGGGRASCQLGEPRDERHHVVEVMGSDDEDGDREPRELVERRLAVALVRRDDDVGPEGDDRLEARREHAADAPLLPRGRRPVAEVGHADQTVLAAEGEDDLRRARHEGDDPLRGRGQRQRVTQHVARGECGRRRRRQDEQA